MVPRGISQGMCQGSPVRLEVLGLRFGGGLVGRGRKTVVKGESVRCEWGTASRVGTARQCTVLHGMVRWAMVALPRGRVACGTQGISQGICQGLPRGVGGPWVEVWWGSGRALATGRGLMVIWKSQLALAF